MTPDDRITRANRFYRYRGRTIDPSTVPLDGGHSTQAPSESHPLPEVLDERAAVDAVLAGDRDAFRVLVERESAAVIRACHRILGDIHEAEDAAQETFVMAFRSLAGWRADGPFGAWLTRIAVRIALRRAQKRRDVSWIDPTDPDRPLDLPGGPDPAASSLRAERSADVRSAVARLDEPYRETVALRYFGELSLDEIAVQTGRPLGTVKTHLHRGLIRLRGLVDASAL
ncbi:MAG: sigma-70 family RNA polymerase sigma factor [Candidatus Limnocylindrales bacterium]